jgi:hypothetical protein
VCATELLPLYVYLISPLPIISLILPSSPLPSLPPLENHLLGERILDPNNSSNINSLIELLRLHITGHIDAYNTTALGSALDARSRAEFGVEGGLAVGTGGCKDAEGVAARCCGTDAAEARDVPGPWYGIGSWGCGGGSEDGEDGDLREHVECRVYMERRRCSADLSVRC